MRSLINRFLSGNCPECSRGDSLVAYLAAKLNCPVNRINSKLVNSISLLQVSTIRMLLHCLYGSQARYRSTESETLETEWERIVYTPHDESVYEDFLLLLDEEGKRFEEYSDPGYLIKRDIEFTSRVQKMNSAENTPPPTPTEGRSQKKRKSIFSLHNSFLKLAFGSAKVDGDSFTHLDANDSMVYPMELNRAQSCQTF